MIDSKRPEILAPVNASDEVRPLLEAGAAWLYGGVLPMEWASRYPSTVLLNQRTFPSAQFPSLQEFEKAVRDTHEGGARFALTLNAPFYMDDQLPAVLDLARRAEDMGVDAVIAADPGLVHILAGGGKGMAVHLSTMGLASNVPAVRMFSRLGVTRVILPRFLTVAQIAALLADAPEVEYEAFVLVGRCSNVEGVCSFTHDDPGQRWPCEWKWKPERTGGGPPPGPVSAHFAGLAASDRRDGCGLCAVPALAAAGVRAFKVVGRGAPVSMKIRLVSVLGRLLSEMPGSTSLEWFDLCRELYSGLFDHPCAPGNCYYPEVPGVW